MYIYSIYVCLNYVANYEILIEKGMYFVSILMTKLLNVDGKSWTATYLINRVKLTKVRF